MKKLITIIVALLLFSFSVACNNNSSANKNEIIAPNGQMMQSDDAFQQFAHEVGQAFVSSFDDVDASYLVINNGISLKITMTDGDFYSYQGDTHAESVLTDTATKIHQSTQDLFNKSGYEDKSVLVLIYSNDGAVLLGVESD